MDSKEVTQNAIINLPRGQVREIDVVIWLDDGELKVRVASPDEK